MKVIYEGYDAGGAVMRGGIEASGRAEASDLLRKKGIFATLLTEEGGASKGGTTGGKADLRQLVQFCRQMSVLVSTHTPIVQTLQALESQAAPGPWRQIIGDLRQRVEEGAQLSEAMAAHPRVFDGVCRSMVAAGESGGMLDIMLTNLARMLRQQLHIRKSVVGAMVYPAVLSVLSVVVLIATVIFVLPRFEDLFKTLQAPLPPTTQFLVTLGAVARGWWWAIAPGLAVPVAWGYFWLRSPKGRVALDRVSLNSPRLGPALRAFYTARFARLLGVLVQARITLLDALVLTRQATGSPSYTRLLEKAEEDVGRGQSLAAALADSGLIVPSVVEAIASGERTGHIGPVLVQIADFMDEDNEQLVKALASLIEPIILSFMGMTVGFVAISMFLPLFDLTGAAGGGGPKP